MRKLREAWGPGPGERGVELLEFVMVLPVILLLLAGVFDFGAAFALWQEMTNAARQCARIAVSSSLTNQSCQSVTPCSIEAAAGAVVQYMAAAGAGVSCIQPAAPASTGPLEWTYSCPTGTSLVIDRGYAIASPTGAMVPATRVTFVYPITWWLARFLPGYAKPSTITTEFTMQNLVN